MAIFWEKVKNTVKKYWQLFLGLGAGLLLAVSVWWRARSQKDVLNNTIKAHNDILKAEEQFQDKVRDVEETAAKDHNDRVEDVKEDLETKEEEIQKEFEDRVEAT